MTKYQLSLSDNKFCEGATKGYFKSFKDNLFCPMGAVFKDMFENGSGKELKSNAKAKAKAAAVHSSSMMAYNMFHWVDENTPVAIRIPRQRRPTAYTRVLFEVKMPCLIGHAKSNMDVVLLSKNGEDALFVESKFTEHLSTRGFSLSKAYSEPRNYYLGVDGEVFRSLVQDVRGWLESEKGGYKEGIKQEICHLVAMNNIVNSEKALAAFQCECNKFDKKSGYSQKTGHRYLDVRKLKRIRFVNLIFDPKSGSGAENQNYKKYFDYYREFARMSRESGAVSQKLAVCSQPMTYSDFWSQIVSCIPKSLQEYLFDRYMSYSGAARPWFDRVIKF